MTKRKVQSDIELKTKKNKTEINDENADNGVVQTKNKSKVKEEKRRKYEKPLGNDGKQSHKHNVKVTKEKPNTVNDSSEKPDWLEFKKKKKELKEKYKAKRFQNVYDISIAAKQIGEKLRRSDCSELERKKLIAKAHDLLQTHYNNIILTHDMSRIVQWILKYCDKDILQAIFNELKPTLLSMIGSKYAKNCVKVMLKNGTQELRHEIISTCYGNVVKLMSHSVSASLLELMYSTWATDVDKIYFKQEFYGDMYKQAKDKNIKSLTDTFETAKDMKDATLSAVKGNLMRILNKKCFNSTLIQSVLLEFLYNCSIEDKAEMIVMLRSSIFELSQTKLGSKVAVMCIWHGTNKDRKIIMKSLKENVKTVAMSEHGYLVLLALFDAVDDTVLLKKILLSEIQNDVLDIALNENGKHVILYLVARRNSHYFAPSIVKYLQEGDNNTASKKPADVREKELLESVSDLLLESIASNTPGWMSNGSIAMVTLAILKVGTGETLKKAFKSICEFITSLNSQIKDGDNEYKPVEHAGLHMMLKKLIQNDKELQEKSQCTFGEVLIDYLQTNVIGEWMKCNRGCFLLIFLLENETTSTVNTLLSKLKPMMSTLKSKTNPGAKILLKKIK